MAVENSQLAGLVLAAICVIPLIGLTIWRHIKYPTRNNQVVDPIAEAEVYAAYGKKKKAIELLERAKLIHPNRADIRKKLEELRIKP